MAKVQEEELVTTGTIPPDDFHDNIERIREVANYNLEIPSDLLQKLGEMTSDLLIDYETLMAAATALQVGNLILQGPPGTGKTSLARALCRAFHCSILPATAHEDWTTYEVIGQQTLKVDDDGVDYVIPKNGLFTEAVIRCAGAIVKHFDDPQEPQATWLLIDELNRAHVDKAFGELFTVLGTDEIIPITLSYQSEGNREMVVPRRFRVVATLNSIDRQFVNSLGQALKRRFNFITVDVPSPRNEGEDWGGDDSTASLASKEFLVVARRAVERMQIRRSLNVQNSPSKDDLTNLLLEQARDVMKSLFELVEKLRYAKRGEDVPYLPIGTAHLIEIVELFLEKIYLEELDENKYPQAMDWAASIKLAPLFDSDAISPADIETFAEQIHSPFDVLLRRELLLIAAAGQYYVE